jgi:hypothetical protein
MNKLSYGSSFGLGVALIVFLQPWLFIGVFLYYDCGHYGPSLSRIILLVSWLAVFCGSVWSVYVSFRQTLRLAGNMVRRIPVITAVSAGIVMAGVICYPVAVIPIGARWIPVKEPTEDRRVIHPKGFSIVSPPGWEVRTWDYDKIDSNLNAYLALNPGGRSRHSPSLFVSIIETPGNLSNFRETTFLDLQAFERTVIKRGENGWLKYELIMAHKDRWYQVAYRESRAFEKNPSSEFPEIMKHYVRSFRPAP